MCASLRGARRLKDGAVTPRGARSLCAAAGVLRRALPLFAGWRPAAVLFRLGAQPLLWVCLRVGQSVERRVLGVLSGEGCLVACGRALVARLWPVC